MQNYRNDDHNDDKCEDNHEHIVNEDGREASDIGIVAVENAPYNIHCLTVIGQIVIIDSVFLIL